MKRNISILLFILIVLTNVIAYADNDGNYVTIGREAVSDYSNIGARTINTSIACVNGLLRIVDDPNTNWQADSNVTWYNNAVWEKDFRSAHLSGNDNNLSDNVDLFAYCGHGKINWDPLLNDTTHDSYKVDNRKIRWGDVDLEWALMYTCNFLNRGITGSNGTGQMMNGIHMICGYGTVMWATNNGGTKFADFIRAGRSVHYSWFNLQQFTQMPNQKQTVIARILTHNTTYNDRLWGYGSVAYDPPSYYSQPQSYYYLSQTFPFPH
jgi:hypothetical protein